jgi:TetR/AcrR family transcriptional regulator, cholesterol catabolism regulator
LTRSLPNTGPMDRIMVAVETHLRYALELSDYASASIRNAAQLPEGLKTRQKKEIAAHERIWRNLFADAIAEGQFSPELDAQMAQMLVMGALNWAAQWWTPRRGSVDIVVANAQLLVRNGLMPRRRAGR